MEKRDRELFARLARINHEYGDIVLHLLSIQYDETEFAQCLRALGEAHAQLGHELTERAAELTKEIEL
ncbi:hypothetical protein [Amycolatopsis orientalis]|uniref:hypothetical protein n=1 Tax=Amycolatopsis orientalis TaxID=31958 RepID=UPI000423CEB2|nr:hypothetical protein [Amycolatopsis orientalis]